LSRNKDSSDNELESSSKRHKENLDENSESELNDQNLSESATGTGAPTGDDSTDNDEKLEKEMELREIALASHRNRANAKRKDVKKNDRDDSEERE
jgi:deferrochelatase/peroxidase EfeB